MADKHSSPYYERGDKYAHGKRVAALAVRLRRFILPDENGYKRSFIERFAVEGVGGIWNESDILGR